MCENIYFNFDEVKIRYCGADGQVQCLAFMNGFHKFIFALMESLVRFVRIAKFRFNKIEKT